jgi:hypothetical protein
MYDDPLKVLFWNLKKSAKRRGKEFRLKFEYFAELALRTGYHIYHGHAAHELHIDRKDHRFGYVPGNVHVITASANSKKSWAERTGWTYDKNKDPF